MTNEPHFSERPSPDEYAAYMEAYVSKVPDGDVLKFLLAQITTVTDLFGPMTNEDAAHRYAPDKWSLKQILGHVTDGERVFAYRAMRIARGDQTPMPGFDENVYAETGRFDRRSLADLLSEFVLTRKATLALFSSMTPKTWVLTGVASDKPCSVRGLAFAMAGHVEHHLRVIHERYLNTEA